MYKVGDIVQVKDWQELAKEYSISSGGTIECPLHFVIEMRSLSNKLARITSMLHSTIYLEGRYKEDNWDWHFSKEILIKL